MSSEGARPESRIRIGVVGMGFGRYGLIPAFRRDPRCEVVAIAAGSLASVQKHRAALGVAQAFGSWSEMLDHAALDAVAIAAPPTVQPAIATAALQRGLGVFAEKPFAASLAEAQALAALAARSGRPNMIDFTFPELATWRMAHTALAEGAIGALRHFVIDWRMESYDNHNRVESWKTDDTRGGGVFQHFVSHALYYVEWLFGPLARMSATLSRAGDLSAGGDTMAVLSLGFAGGVSGSLTACSAAPFGVGHRIEVYGTDGCLRLFNSTSDPIAGFELSIATLGEPRFRSLSVEPATPGGKEDTRVAPVSRLTTRFLDWCIGGTPAAPDFAAGLRTQVLIDAAQESNRSGRTVALAG